MTARIWAGCAATRALTRRSRDGERASVVRESSGGAPPRAMLSAHPRSQSRNSSLMWAISRSAPDSRSRSNKPSFISTTSMSIGAGAEMPNLPSNHASSASPSAYTS